MEFVIFAGFALYLLPSFVAAARDHHRTETVVGLNLLLGWTAVGWGALLWWAATSRPTPARPAPAHLRLVAGKRPTLRVPTGGVPRRLEHRAGAAR